MLLMVFLPHHLPLAGHRPAGWVPAERSPKYGPGAESCPPWGRTAFRGGCCPASCRPGRGPVVAHDGGHGGTRSCGAYRPRQLKTWPDLKEVAYDGDKQILPLTGRPGPTGVVWAQPLLLSALVVLARRLMTAHGVDAGRPWLGCVNRRRVHPACGMAEELRTAVTATSVGPRPSPRTRPEGHTWVSRSSVAVLWGSPRRARRHGRDCSGSPGADGEAVPGDRRVAPRGGGLDEVASARRGSAALRSAGRSRLLRGLEGRGETGTRRLPRLGSARSAT